MHLEQTLLFLRAEKRVRAASRHRGEPWAWPDGERRIAEAMAEFARLERYHALHARTEAVRRVRARLAETDVPAEERQELAWRLPELLRDAHEERAQVQQHRKRAREHAVPCACCGRTFAFSRLEEHQRACRPFDDAAREEQEGLERRAKSARHQ